MPVDLPTTYGKADYNVTKALELLASGLNALESTVAKIAPGAGMAEVRAEITQLSARVDILTRQVQVLQQAP